MIRKAALEERRADERRLHAALGDALELADGEARRLHRQDGDGEQAAAVGGGEVDEPVVVGARERPRDVRVLDHREVLGEERREEERPLDAHRVHVAEARRGILRTGRDRMVLLRVELPDLLGRHAGAPARLAVDPAPTEGPRATSVQDRRLDAVGIDVVPEGTPCGDAVIAVEMLLPDIRRLVDVAVDVDNCGHHWSASHTWRLINMASAPA